MLPALIVALSFLQPSRFKFLHHLHVSPLMCILPVTHIYNYRSVVGMPLVPVCYSHQREIAPPLYICHCPIQPLTCIASSLVMVVSLGENISHKSKVVQAAILQSLFKFLHTPLRPQSPPPPILLITEQNFIEIPTHHPW
jgi:hypothetical protein